MNAFLARVALWGKAKALSLDEARLEVGRVCELGVGKGAGEGRQDTQDIEKDNGLKKDGRCMCTGTPTFGLPPVFSGPVAVFMACVYAVFDPMILHVGPWWVLFQHGVRVHRVLPTMLVHGVERRRTRWRGGREPTYRTVRQDTGFVPVHAAWPVGAGFPRRMGQGRWWVRVWVPGWLQVGWVHVGSNEGCGPAYVGWPGWFWAGCPWF